MNNNYSINYCNSITKGLKDTIFFEKNSNIKSNIFFEKINQKLNKIRDNRNKIYFFGNGASSAFANHMALDFSKNGKIHQFVDALLTHPDLTGVHLWRPWRIHWTAQSG